MEAAIRKPLTASTAVVATFLLLLASEFAAGRLRDWSEARWRRARIARPGFDL